MANQQLADIGLIGLAVMGQNLVLNMADHGFTVAVFNRTVSKVFDFLDGEAAGKSILGANDIQAFVALLKKPRKIMILVQAGPAVDAVISQLVPLLDKEDIIIDGGNSLYVDTMRRYDELTAKGLYFVGSGVSGGEEGARHGPSLMPGGSIEAWPLIKDIFQSIAAKVDNEPCCDWMGENGAGHFVKMVHNGIEYADMQLICEAFHILKDTLQMSYDELGAVFDSWNKTELSSYLIEIAADIMRYRTKENEVLLEKIRDVAGQKGTGKWTVMATMNLNSPATVITEAVYCRTLSGLIDERAKASTILPVPRKLIMPNDRREFIEHVRRALYCSKIVCYAQGFMIFKEAAKHFNWSLDYGKIAMAWRGGCIIRSAFLGAIKKAFDANPNLENLLLDNFFRDEIAECQESWRFIVASAVSQGIPIPCFSSALAFYDSYRAKWLPANLVQAFRDYFGAHTYELLDSPGVFHHTDWTGHGGKVTASTYNA